jgi:hypothetical protein
VIFGEIEDTILEIAFRSLLGDDVCFDIAFLPYISPWSESYFVSYLMSDQGFLINESITFCMYLSMDYSCFLSLCFRLCWL